MGPDCGTAIVNGVPLGFANVVRRGDIGLVAASGTGLQEVTCRIHNLGGGVSQALGTGGRDLKEEIGGITMLQGLAALAADPATRVIVLISKPPAPAIARQIEDAAGAAGKPVVVHFLGATPRALARRPVRRRVVAARRRRAPWRSPAATPAPMPPATPSDAALAAVEQRAATMAPAQTAVRALFTGGTFCYEAQLAFLARGLRLQLQRPGQARSRSPVDGRFDGHVFLDLGDDDYTRGRPHPMIDPSLRDAAVRTQGADPHTAAILFDVVLGFGSHDDPARRTRAGAGGRAARGARAGPRAGADRPRLRHRRRPAGQGGAGAASWKPPAPSSSAATSRRHGSRRIWPQLADAAPRSARCHATTLFKDTLTVVNVGLEGFGDDIVAAGGACVALRLAAARARRSRRRMGARRSLRSPARRSGQRHRVRAFHRRPAGADRRRRRRATCCPAWRAVAA